MGLPWTGAGFVGRIKRARTIRSYTGGYWAGGRSYRLTVEKGVSRPR